MRKKTLAEIREGDSSIQNEDDWNDKVIRVLLADKYIHNEAANRHTENVLLLAEYYGTATQVKSIETILKMKVRRGYINESEYSFINLMSKQLFKNIRQEYLEARKCQ